LRGGASHRAPPERRFQVVVGVAASPTTHEQAAACDRRVQATAPQTQHFNTARSMTTLRSTQNNGQPPIMATNRAGRFDNAGVV
jgi:hypothetical protein